MKKAVSLLLALMMALGCWSFAFAESTDATEAPAATDAVATDATAAEENPWANLDLSQYEEINFYVVGVMGPDWQEIVDKANELMIKKINTKVNFIPVSWGDFQSKYSLFLAGDEDVDLIYGAAWCNYSDYVKAGAYAGFDWDFVEKYMPLTAKSQA